MNYWVVSLAEMELSKTLQFEQYGVVTVPRTDRQYIRITPYTTVFLQPTSPPFKRLKSTYRDKTALYYVLLDDGTVFSHLG